MFGIEANMVMTHCPADVPLPATTVPPVQVTIEVPVVAVSEPPWQPAPRLLPADNSIGTLDTVGNVSVKFTLLAAPADQLLIVTV